MLVKKSLPVLLITSWTIPSFADWQFFKLSNSIAVAASPEDELIIKTNIYALIVIVLSPISWWNNGSRSPRVNVVIMRVVAPGFVPVDIPRPIVAPQSMPRRSRPGI